jgi:mono/diheme cytochrome c family protein
MIIILILLPFLTFANENLDLILLQKKLTSKIITVDDPVYKKKKTYEGFPLMEVLKILGLNKIGEAIEFHCADGYKPILELEQVEKGEPYLVFRDVDSKEGKWESFEVGKGKKTPDPFYLVWPKPTMEAQWPYQIVALAQIDFSKKYSKIFPPEMKKLSGPVRSGFSIFRDHCLKCHSINLEGGELGPELNIPKNITEYRNNKYLRAFISDSNTYRLKSSMPPFKDILTKKQIDEVLAYISWMKKFKVF